MTNRQPVRLLLTMGDPAGVGPEVLLKALNRPPLSASVTIVGDVAWLKLLSARLGIRFPWDRFGWIDLAVVPKRLRWGRPHPSTGKAAYTCLKEAARRLTAGSAEALVTAPVSKAAIAKAGIPWVGHTEFLASSFGRQTVMMFVTGRFRVSLVTTHLAIRELPRRLTVERVVATIRKSWESLRLDFGIRHPRIGVAALNPHAGEGGLFGDEEKRILLPALKLCHREAVGPLPVDSLMQAAVRGDFDAVVALYHDQALIPIKLIGWEKAVNVTLGLPFVRTSPVHGTAFDKAGTGEADSRSMQSAIQLAIELARRRRAP